VSNSPDITGQDAGSRPKIIFVAGHPRSGSTWQFNALRLLLERAGVDLHACWVGDYRAGAVAPVHLVKLHAPEDMVTDPDLVFVTERNVAESLVSLARMGWIKDGDRASLESQHQSLLRQRDFWRRRASHVTDYATIGAAPEREITEMAAKLGLTLDAAELARVAEELEALSSPGAGASVDPVTHLHPGHRLSELDASAKAEALRLRSWVDAYLSEVADAD
jgi:hypothetical protein